jgi:mRNA interferase MazF
MKYKKDFDEWNRKKKKLDEKEREIYFRAKEIWWCSLGVNIGYEQDGKNKNFERPVLIIKKINRHLALTIPLSSKVKDGHPYYVPYDFEGIVHSAIVFQIKATSIKRLQRRIGIMNEKDFKNILGFVQKFPLE